MVNALAVDVAHADQIGGDGRGPRHPALRSGGVTLHAVFARVWREIPRLVAVAVNVAVAVLDVGGLGPDDGAASAEA